MGRTDENCNKSFPNKEDLHKLVITTKSQKKLSNRQISG